MVLVNVCFAVSSFCVLIRSVMIEAVVCLMTVAHLYCKNNQKPYTHTNTIHNTTRYFNERFMESIIITKKLFIS
jgi:hypothetical protein